MKNSAVLSTAQRQRETVPTKPTKLSIMKFSPQRRMRTETPLTALRSMKHTLLPLKSALHADFMSRFSLFLNTQARAAAEKLSVTATMKLLSRLMMRLKAHRPPSRPLLTVQSLPSKLRTVKKLQLLLLNLFGPKPELMEKMLMTTLRLSELLSISLTRALQTETRPFFRHSLAAAESADINGFLQLTNLAMMI